MLYSHFFFFSIFFDRNFNVYPPRPYHGWRRPVEEEEKN
jgi:hypothetical protein